MLRSGKSSWVGPWLAGPSGVGTRSSLLGPSDVGAGSSLLEPLGGGAGPLRLEPLDGGAGPLPLEPLEDGAGPLPLEPLEDGAEPLLLEPLGGTGPLPLEPLGCTGPLPAVPLRRELLAGGLRLAWLDSSLSVSESGPNISKNSSEYVVRAFLYLDARDAAWEVRGDGGLKGGVGTLDFALVDRSMTSWPTSDVEGTRPERRLEARDLAMAANIESSLLLSSASDDPGARLDFRFFGLRGDRALDEGERDLFVVLELRAFVVEWILKRRERTTNTHSAGLPTYGGVPRYRVASSLGLTLCTRRLGWSCSSLDAEDLKTWSLYRTWTWWSPSGYTSLGTGFLGSIDLVESDAPGTMYPFGG
ncbi:unnamed protein product [Peronospora effusa]|nr:unnamed protein product [Peronospora effusa]